MGMLWGSKTKAKQSHLSAIIPKQNFKNRMENKLQKKNRLTNPIEKHERNIFCVYICVCISILIRSKMQSTIWWTLLLKIYYEQKILMADMCCMSIKMCIEILTLFLLLVSFVYIFLWNPCRMQYECIENLLLMLTQKKISFHFIQLLFFLLDVYVF